MSYKTMTESSMKNIALLKDTSVEVKISIDSTYSLHFTYQMFDPENHVLANMIQSDHKKYKEKIMFIVDQGIVDHFPDLQQQIMQYCKTHQLNEPSGLTVLPGGEEAKSQQQIERLHQEMLDLQLDRHSYVVAIGGGAVIDSAGYAATTFHRGIPLIRVPTTVLAQNDAGIGVKNGINAFGIKNILGCFSTPCSVINDNEWLTTLPDRDYRSGFAEAVKVALIRDGEFYQWLYDNAQKLSSRNQEACIYLIKRCAELHLNQIQHGGDPFEKGSARPLDYGHWSAHKIESLSNYELSHGEAVAIGMALDAVYALETGLLSESDTMSICRLLQALGFKLYHPALSAVSAQGHSRLLEGLEEFRQHLGGKLCITLLTGLGNDIEVNTIDTNIMLKAVQMLQQLSGSTISIQE